MKSKDLLQVILKLVKIVPLAPNGSNLNMRAGNVNRDYECGSVHCHAGWYAIAACDLTQPLTFYNGACQMAKDLGFEDYTGLLNWARQHNKVWGNYNGERMFTSEDAFFNGDKRPKGAKTLQDIIDHWTEVYYRLKEREELAEY